MKRTLLAIAALGLTIALAGCASTADIQLAEYDRWTNSEIETTRQKCYEAQNATGKAMAESGLTGSELGLALAIDAMGKALQGDICARSTNSFDRDIAAGQERTKRWLGLGGTFSTIVGWGAGAYVAGEAVKARGDTTTTTDSRNTTTDDHSAAIELPECIVNPEDDTVTNAPCR